MFVSMKLYLSRCGNVANKLYFEKKIAWPKACSQAEFIILCYFSFAPSCPATPVLHRLQTDC